MLISFLDASGRTLQADLASPIDLSIPLRHGAENPNCFWAPMPEFTPVVAGAFIGSIEAGAPVNFYNVRFNPHGNGTHTECVGHISKEHYTIRACLKQYHFSALLLSLYPTKTDAGDRVIFREQLEAFYEEGEYKALIIRTLPNEEFKMRTTWSGSNPPYLHPEATAWIVEKGIEHLLIDLPSIDREEDGGLLLGHKAFWQYPEAPRTHCTITEMIYVPNHVRDGHYLLNLQSASLELDAAPSKPVLFPLRYL